MTITAKPFKAAPHKAQIKKLYMSAFPKEERLPWCVLRAAANLRCDLTAYYDGDKFCGFTYGAAAGDIVYIMFLAVAQELQGQGCGSAILEHIRRSNPEKTVLLNVEIVDEKAPNNDQRIRRMAFYEKNGFVDTGYDIREVGGIFHILSNTGKMDAEDYQRVFLHLSYGLWKPPITKTGKEKP